METGRHFYTGEATGNPLQPAGRHREGVGFIPLGDRNRAIFEFGVDVLEERDSVDKYSRVLHELNKAGEFTRAMANNKSHPKR